MTLPMDEDIFRLLCIALRKATNGNPVAVDDEELDEPFELKVNIGSDGCAVQILDGE